MTFNQHLDNLLDEIREMLLKKNQSYGDSALSPMRIFSKANTIEQLYVRVDDKLSRIARRKDYHNEDTELDLIGCLLILRIAKQKLENIK